MAATVTPLDIALRLLAALAAGIVIGLDRSARGRSAGLRTTILMCLAATGAMIEANLMLGVMGKTDQSFTMMDALRFPLGILSGIGFIGAGTIMRRGSLVTGITTAATMWLVTVIGLILGAGYIVFGGVMTVLAFVVLHLLKNVEPLLLREHRAHLVVKIDGSGPGNNELHDLIAAAGYKITTFAILYDGPRRLECHLEWYDRRPQDCIPLIVEHLAERQGILAVEWQPVEAGHVFE